MPAGKLLACESYGPLGTNALEGRSVSEADALWENV